MFEICFISCNFCFLQATNYELRLQKSETEIKTLREENRLLENKVYNWCWKLAEVIFSCSLYDYLFSRALLSSYSAKICFVVQWSREYEVCRKTSSELEENKLKYKDDVSFFVQYNISFSVNIVQNI